MLDLKPRVHLEEIEIAVLVDDELDRAGGVVADGLGQRDGLRAHRRAGLGVDERARRLLDHLLIAALDRAFALAEMDDVAVLVAEHLNLDMARLLDIFLDEHAVVAEARLGLRLRRVEAFLHLFAAIGDAHALAAAAGRRLDHHRIADLVGDLGRLLGVLDHAEMAGHGRDLRLGGELLRLDLVAHRLDGLDVRADENDAGLCERAGEGGVLRKEAVAGMDGVGAGLLGGGDDLVDVEIGLARGGAGRYAPPRPPCRRAARRGRRRNRPRPSGCRAAAPSCMMRQAISPRLAMSSLANMVGIPASCPALLEARWG